MLAGLARAASFHRLRGRLGRPGSEAPWRESGATGFEPNLSINAGGLLGVSGSLPASSRPGQLPSGLSCPPAFNYTGHGRVGVVRSSVDAPSPFTTETRTRVISGWRMGGCQQDPTGLLEPLRDYG